MHKFRAATFECNAGQCEIELLLRCLTRAISDVLNSFINSRLITKSNDLVWVLFRGHVSRPYNKTGMHLLILITLVL